MCARRRFLIPSNKSHLRQPTPKKSLVCVAAGTPRRTRGRDTAGSPADGGLRTWPGDRLSCPQLRYFSHVDFIHFSFFPLLSKTDALYYDRLSLSPLTGSITRLLPAPNSAFPFFPSNRSPQNIGRRKDLYMSVQFTKSLLKEVTCTNAFTLSTPSCFRLDYNRSNHGV